MIVLELPESIAATVDSMAARAGMTSSSWLAAQVEHAFGTGRVTAEPKRRTHRGRRSRAKLAQMAAERAARTTAPETTEPTDV